MKWPCTYSTAPDPHLGEGGGEFDRGLGDGEGGAGPAVPPMGKRGADGNGPFLRSAIHYRAAWQIFVAYSGERRRGVRERDERGSARRSARLGRGSGPRVRFSRLRQVGSPTAGLGEGDTPSQTWQ